MASIDAIEGIGHKNATKLRKARVRTTEALLRETSTRSARRQLASATSLSETQLLAWANRADLLRIKGIGEEYADLLGSVGVDTIKELRRRNPKNLLEALAEVNVRRRLVRRLPTESMVDGWVDHAKAIDPIVRS